jgi:hypothetical protein
VRQLLIEAAVSSKQNLKLLHEETKKLRGDPIQ